MARILILYEHPKAIHDILKWADEKGIKLNEETAYHHFYHKEDYFSIIPIESAINYTNSPVINKLILFGSFTRKDIINISQIRFEDN